MKKHSFALLAALIGVLALGVSAAVSQEDMKIVKAEAFTAHTRPADFVKGTVFVWPNSACRGDITCSGDAG